MKKLIYLIILLVSLTGTCFANPITNDIPQKPTIALVIADYGQVRSNKDAMQIIKDRVKEKFPETKFNLVTSDEMIMQVTEYAEDEEIDDPIKIKKAQLVAFGKKNNYDYVIFLIFRQANARGAVDFWAVKYHVNVDLIAKIADVNNNTYVYRKTITEEAKSSAGIGMPSTINAWRKAVDKCMVRFNEEVTLQGNVSDK